MLADVLPGWPGAKIGFQNQKKLCEQRSDMLGWVSEPLSEPLHIAGKIDATVRFASTAEDTAVNIRVVEVQPSGKRIHVREGIQVLSFREGREQVAEYTPGDVIDVEVSTWPIEYQFQAGSRILFEVASASFPKFAAHGNVAEPWASVKEPITAKQTVQLEGTVLRLPVVK
jgi:putative CocE/NonD family hydrolase